MKAEYLIFDLDNTLYSGSSEMCSGITNRMLNCVADFFHITYSEALEYRSKHIKKFSTTLEWLLSEGLTDTEKYFAAVHPVDEIKELPEDKHLRSFLLSLKQPKVVLTNSPMEHAVRVLNHLGVKDLFKSIIDIRACNLKGKPYSAAYETALDAVGGTICNTVFFDDQTKYTNGWAALGGTSIFVGDGRGYGEEYSFPDDNNLGNYSGQTIRLNSIYEFPLDGIL